MLSFVLAMLLIGSPLSHEEKQAWGLQECLRTAADFDYDACAVELDDEGYFFAASSESHAIDAQEYGTTFTDETFVRTALAQHIPEGQLLRFAPTWFWNHQDAWVVRRT